jgi:hypothetical protein
VRDLAEVQAVATAAGFRPREIISMPANNLSLVFAKKDGSVAPRYSSRVI